jgi:hypothetical protein
MNYSKLERFFGAYERDWATRCLRKGDVLEDVLSSNPRLASSYPRSISSSIDKERLAGIDSTYRAFIVKMGNTSLELPFSVSMNHYSEIGWREDRCFFANHHEGSGYFAFRRTSRGAQEEVFGISETDEIVAPVASSFCVFLDLLSFSLERGANRSIGMGPEVWEFLRLRDPDVAGRAPAFWAALLEI